MRRPAILAVDGGGSKVDAVLLGGTGEVLGTARVLEPKWDRTGDDLHMDSIQSALGGACADAGLDPDVRPVADLGVYCLAGADLPADDRRILRGLADRGFSAENVLRNDTFAVLRAGTERDWGVGVVCGFGTNCSGVAPDGRIYRFPAIGGVSGDWGGGMDIGSDALWHALRARDGRGPRTALSELVPAHFGLRTPRQVMERLYFGRMETERLAELPPVVFRAAAKGDGIARGIVDRQADEVVIMAGAAIRKLRMAALDVDVVLGGGIFRNRFPTFFDRIRDGLQELCPQVGITVLTAPPIVGAAMLGLDRIGASTTSKSRVRAALTHERLLRIVDRLREEENAWPGSSSTA
ncbi:MAG TPA: BadF/BadG/BcrA/BcrD ATPase family protein [Actinomycetota bacterium]